MNSTSNSIREKSRKSTRSNNTKKQSIPGLNTNQKQKQKIKTNPQIINNDLIISQTSFNLQNSQNVSYINEPQNCSKCNNLIMKSALLFPCQHILCISCLSRQMLQTGLDQFKNEKNSVTINCFCSKSIKLEISFNKLFSLFYIDDNCIEHGENSSCKKCIFWTTQLTQVKSCNIHIKERNLFHCNNCNVDFCQFCKSDHINHNVDLLEVLKNEINIFKNEKLKYKNFASFNKNLKDIQQIFLKDFHYELNKNLNKIDECVYILTKIKNEYMTNMSEKMKSTNKIFDLIKYIYYYYYKDLCTVQNDYSILKFLHESKFELQNINFETSNKLNENLNLIKLYLSKATSEPFKFDINIRNNYAYATQKFTEHKGYIFDLLQINSQLLASCSEDKNIIIWDLYENNIYKKIEAHKSAIYSLCKQRHKKRFFSGSFSEIKIWSKETFENIGTLLGHTDYIIHLKILTVPKKEYIKESFESLGSSSNDNTIKIWDIDKLICIYTLIGHTDKVNSFLQFDNNYSQLISCSDDKLIKFWTIENEKNFYTIDENDSPIYSMIKLKDGRFVTGTYRDIKIWDFKEKKCDIVFNEFNMGVYCLFELNDGRLASSSYRIINFWDLNEKKLIYSLEAHDNFITCILILKNGKLASCSDDQSIKIWE